MAHASCHHTSAITAARGSPSSLQEFANAAPAPHHPSCRPTRLICVTKTTLGHPQSPQNHYKVQSHPSISNSPQVPSKFKMGSQQTKEEEIIIAPNNINGGQTTVSNSRPLQETLIIAIFLLLLGLIAYFLLKSFRSKYIQSIRKEAARQVAQP
ncbi:hypothetical protein ABEB36_000171 [Hypothenemus hampei]|uniref:Uncharacterized protein n=1 Tax=Hypothenemus hampei TaxID=57062 RepID=A0ABD1E1Z4_HYPHA